METLLKILVFGGPVALAALGMVVTERTPKGRERWLWLGAFGVACVVTVGASVFDSLGNDQRITQIWEYQTGGNNYLVIKALEADLKTRPEKLRFVIGASGPLQRVHFHIHPASSKGDANSPDYLKLSKEGGTGIWMPVGNNGGLMGSAFPAGSYRIEMDAPNGHFVEYLNIFEFNGELVQTVDVIKDGKTVFSSPRP